MDALVLMMGFDVFSSLSAFHCFILDLAVKVLCYCYKLAQCFLHEHCLYIDGLKAALCLSMSWIVKTKGGNFRSFFSSINLNSWVHVLCKIMNIQSNKNILMTYNVNWLSIEIKLGCLKRYQYNITYVIWVPVKQDNVWSFKEQWPCDIQISPYSTSWIYAANVKIQIGSRSIYLLSLTKFLPKYKKTFH